mgnify:CR=1 FL=1
MNNSSDNKGKKILGYLFPGLITLLVMLIVLVAKGIWPFGSSRIDLFDNAAGGTIVCTFVGCHAW